MKSTSLSVDAQKEKRRWIYAKKVSGSYFAYRQYVGYTLLALLLSAPFLKIGGEPLLMFKIIERKFFVFGSVFYPQDLHIFVFGMLIAMVCIVLFTVVYGRIWCGWACPQTIFMELIFRRIEYWIEGDANQQRRLNKGSWTKEKLIKKVSKHAVFFLISFLIANLFLSYIIGVDALVGIITDPVQSHFAGFVSIMLFTLVFYAVFAFAREIVCTTICPYGRLQGVLLDDQSISVAYHYRRGEPRGSIRKAQADKTLGDCVDCNLCVQVCPTGIDIRNGIQMECINCTACMDACDGVMEKVRRPKGLIGFYSQKEIEFGPERKKNVRAIAYSVVLLVLVGIFCGLILNRSVVDGTLLRASGTSYIFRDDGTVTNLYNMELTNKSSKKIPFGISSADRRFQVQVLSDKKMLAAGETLRFSLFLIIPKKEVGTYKTSVKLCIGSEGKVIKKMKTNFVAPPVAQQRGAN
ncbi:cytochrome c oxidase accessory protein CcoG [Olivibacter sp. XZL3]|uniref:cytochrome c oxidase accessory protein CcoG n=1 Tax=Olivibacter sp. XZL3 TaxID=1735116 RepID=UPI0010670E34|nr:cytochrome c oxidase accessory protein CcoG [Olivibacter sp. XZL3]